MKSVGTRVHHEVEDPRDLRILMHVLDFSRSDLCYHVLSCLERKTCATCSKNVERPRVVPSQAVPCCTDRLPSAQRTGFGYQSNHKDQEWVAPETQRSCLLYHTDLLNADTSYKRQDRPTLITSRPPCPCHRPLTCHCCFVRPSLAELPLCRSSALKLRRCCLR